MSRRLTRSQTSSSLPSIANDGTQHSEFDYSPPSSLPSSRSPSPLRTPLVTSQDTLTLSRNGSTHTEPRRSSRLLSTQDSSVQIVSQPLPNAEEVKEPTQDSSVQEIPAYSLRPRAPKLANDGVKKKPKRRVDVVKRIVAKYDYDGTDYYEVEWEGWDTTSNTLEPIENLLGAPEAMKDFIQQSKRERSNILSVREYADKTVENDDKIREIVNHLLQHTNQDQRDMQIYAQHWWDTSLITNYQIAMAIAKLHGWQWFVDRNDQDEKQLAEEAKQAVEEVVESQQDIELAEVDADELPQRDEQIVDPLVINIGDSDEDSEVEVTNVVRRAVRFADRKQSNEGFWAELQPSALASSIKYSQEDLNKKLPSTERSGYEGDLFRYKFSESTPANRLLRDIFGEETKRLDELPGGVLDKIAFVDLEVHKISLLNCMSQLCAVSLDAKRVFNKYVQHFSKPFLAEAWQQLVVSGYVDGEPCDDPKLALPFNDVILEFCNYWPSGTLFLYQGTNDYYTLMDNFRLNMDSDHFAEALGAFRERQYRFLSADPLFKLKALPHPLKGKLNVIYKKCFCKTLIYNTKMKTLLYSADTKALMSKLLANEFKLIDPGFPAAQLASHERVDIWYWTEGDMQPVFHNAHTDALVLRNATIAVLLFLIQGPVLYSQRGHTRDDALRAEYLELIWNEMMTCVVAKTAVFREFHLGCDSEHAARYLWQIVGADQTKLHNSYFSPIAIDLKRIHSRVVSNDDADVSNNKVYRAGIYSRAEVTSPERPEAEFQAAEIQDDEAPAPLYAFTVYASVQPIGAKHPSKVTMSKRKDTLQDIIFQARQNLQGNGSKLPKEFQYNRTDLQNFEDANKKRLPWLKTTPCIVVMKSSSQARFPKTFLLHCYGCRHISYESLQGAKRKSHEQSLNVIDFSKNPVFSFRFRFCKDCKQWDNRELALEPAFGLRAEQRQEQQQAHKDDSRLDRMLDVLANQRVNSQPQVIQVQAPPVVVNYQGPETRSRSQNSQQLQPLAQRPPRLVGLRSTDVHGVRVYQRGE